MQILCGGALTLHCVARDGVKVVNTSGNGNGNDNAVTCISISEGKDITLCKGTSFAKVYNGNDNCVEYANKASAYSGSGVGSGTRGIYIDSATDKPQPMQYSLNAYVPAVTRMIRGTCNGIGLGLTRDNYLCLNYAAYITNNMGDSGNLPVTANKVYEFVLSVVSSLL